MGASEGAPRQGQRRLLRRAEGRARLRVGAVRLRRAVPEPRAQGRTGPADAVFDCWTGLYLFRPNASYYHFLNWDLIEVLDNQALRDVLLEDLADESCRVVIRDRHHQFLHPDVRRVIAERFVPSPEFKYILFRDGDFDLNHDGRP